jgi:cobyrinic acid a,c-diamide synthase
LYFCSEIKDFGMIKPQILIAAAGSNSGKTTVTLGLLRALRERGLRVQPFKCGPDYIDPKYHQLASGEESVNLDGWFASPEHLRQVYATYGAEAEVLVTEGVMGLFDGYDRMKGSSAELALQLGVPVLLVVNARSTAYSVAPLIYGYRHFHPEVKVLGVLFNQVASENHYRLLAQACQDAGVECLGYLPRMKEIELPSRHLGLTLESQYLFESYSLQIAQQLERTADLDRMLQLYAQELVPAEPPLSVQKCSCTEHLRIAVAKDEAFNFCYRENLDVLRRYGSVTFFSPIKDTTLPEADFIYLSGGYPEYYLQELSQNQSMRTALREYVEGDGRLLAECGGMMYLCESIVGMDEATYPMVGVLPMQATMEHMRLHLGYRSFIYQGKCYKGHEFHYSSLVPSAQTPPSLATLYDARGKATDTAFYAYKQVRAGYTHLYWGEETPFGLWDV